MKYLKELRPALRMAVDDTVKPYRVADATLDRFLNDAENEACRRARLILDTSTREICTLKVKAGEPLVKLDRRVIFIRRARIEGGCVLGRVSRKALDQRIGGSWEDEEGEVVGYVPDWQTDYLRLFRIPTENATINLQVVRLPRVPMSKDDDALEVREEVAESLLEWAKYRFFSLPDTEINNPKAADAAASAFAGEFGIRSTALDEEWLRENADFLIDEGNF